MLTFCAIVYIQLAINTQNFMQMLTCRPKLYQFWIFGGGNFYFFNGGYYKIRWYVHTLGMIRYTVDHQYTHFYANIHMYNKVIKILSFQWRPFWKFKMAVTAKARSRFFISYMILIITNYQYTKFHVNIHMHNKVIEILSFQWRPFWKFKMAVTTAARSCVFISYMILILKNY